MRQAFLLSVLIFRSTSGDAQTADAYGSEVVNAYYRICKPLVTTTPESSPMLSSRAFGYMGIALYEAVVPGMPGHSSLQGHLPLLGPLTAISPGVDYHWPTCASYVLCRMIDSLFVNMTPALYAQIHAIRDNYDALFSAVPFATLVRSRAFGEAIAEDVLDMARTDGGHLPQFSNYDPLYVPPTGYGMWVPEPGQVPLQPHWGWKRPFLEADTSMTLLSNSPPPFDTLAGSICFDAAMEVYDTTINITTWQLTTVSYWADGNQTPPNHSIQMLEQVLRHGNHDLGYATRAYAMLGMSLADAFVACWKLKYMFTWQRPRNFINLYIDTDWNTWIPTPPFPDYTSGHSTQSGAWAQVMTHLFGASFPFTDSTHGALHGGPRSYPDFWACAEETAMSRLYAGIHFRYANQDGLVNGGAVAQNVIDLFDELVTGLPDLGTTQGISLHVDANGDLRLPSGLTEEVILFDPSGREVLRGRGPVIHLGHLSSGTYVIRDRSGTGRAMRFFVP